MKKVLLFEEFQNEPVNEGLKDVLQSVKALAKEMAQKYAEDAAEFVDDTAAMVKFNPEKDTKRTEQQINKEVSIDEGLVQKIKDFAKKATTITGMGAAISGAAFIEAYAQYLDNRFYEWYYKNIQKLADYEIINLLQQKHGIYSDINSWEANVAKYAFMAFFIAFVVSYATKFITKKASEGVIYESEEFYKTYSSAIDSVKDSAEEAGYELDMDEYGNAYTDAFDKPKEGQTKENSITLYKNGKKQRKAIHVSIYGRKNGFEVTTYIN